MNIAVISPASVNCGTTTIASFIALELGARGKKTCLTHTSPKSSSMLGYFGFDEDDEDTLEEFDTDYTGNGYIAILDGSESIEVIEGKLGLTGGLDEVIPESAENFFIGSDKWSRVIVIYNDSFGMILWLKNYDGFDSYVTDKKSYSFNDLAAPF